MATEATLMQTVRDKLDDNYRQQDAINDAGNISASVTNITVDDGTKFTPGDIIQIESELCLVEEVPWIVTYINEGADFSSTDVTLTVVAGTNIANNDYIQLESEILQVTAGGTTTSLTVTRGQMGTMATSHSDKTAVGLVNEIKVRRAYMGTTGATHANDIAIYVIDQYSNKEIQQAIEDGIRALGDKNNPIFDAFDRFLYDDTDTSAEALDIDELVLTVTTGTKFAVDDIIQIENELMKVTAVNTNDLTITRGYNGTAAIAHATTLTIYILTQTSDTVFDYALPTNLYWINEVRVYNHKANIANTGILDYTRLTGWRFDQDKQRLHFDYNIDSDRLIYIIGASRVAVPATTATEITAADYIEELITLYAVIQLMGKRMAVYNNSAKYSTKVAEAGGSSEFLNTWRMWRDMQSQYDTLKDRYASGEGSVDININRYDL